MHHTIHTLNFSELCRHIKTVEIKVKDVQKGDIITQFITHRGGDGTVQAAFSAPWIVSKIKKRKYCITLFDQSHGSIELPINIARPNEANTVQIIPRTFLNCTHIKEYQ